MRLHCTPRQLKFDNGFSKSAGVTRIPGLSERSESRKNNPDYAHRFPKIQIFDFFFFQISINSNVLVFPYT